MTEIRFHLNAQDRLHYACRLLRKAVRQSARLVVTGSDQTLAELDHALWMLAATEFVPHCLASAPERVRARSPIVLCSVASTFPARPILLNLADDVPANFDQFERIIEIVSTDEVDKKLARLRWKRYASAGLTPQQHDLNTSS